MGCYNSCVVSASPDEVWKALRPFHAMAWAPNVIQSVESAGDVPDGQAGAQRILNGAIHETLRTIDDEARTFTYTLDDGPEPLSTTKDFTGVVRVCPITSEGKTFVEWSSTWRDGAGGVTEFCDTIYQALLTDLQAQFA